MEIKRRLAEFESLTPAEEKLLAEIGEGKPVIIGDGERPAANAAKERQVSVTFLRYLILGGCAALPKPVPEKGVRLFGALISGRLDLEGCSICRDIELARCRFDAPPVLRSARVETLDLDDAVLPGLKADRLNARGGVFLRRVKSTAEVRLVGAILGRNLECGGARVTAKESGRALSADGMTAHRVVLQRVIAWGDVRLASAKIGGDLFCDGARFRQRKRKGGRALHLQTSEIIGGFVLREKARIEGLLDLTAAQLGTIVDEKASWPAPGDLLVDRCRYGAFVGSPVTADERIDWLSRQAPAQVGAEFRPQPWEQCAEVLRRMGHGEDARKILIEKEKRQRRARRARLGRVGRAVVGAGDVALGLTTRYGRRPLVAFLWLAGLWVVGAEVFYGADQYAALKPNDSIVLRSPEWAACAEDGARRGDGDYASQLACFEDQPEAAGHPAFQPAVYSADTLLPFVDLEMQSFWIPDGAADWRFAAATRWYLWVHIALGWALSLLAVAGFSGLIKTGSQ